MPKVTEADRRAATELSEALKSKTDWSCEGQRIIAQAFARHRESARNASMMREAINEALKGIIAPEVRSQVAEAIESRLHALASAAGE